MTHLSMKGDATMVQLILLVLIVWMIAGLVGIIWMVVRHSFKDNDYSSKNRLGGSPRRNHVTGRPHTDPHPSS